jgi:hypothetical protein
MAIRSPSGTPDTRHAAVLPAPAAARAARTSRARLPHRAWETRGDLKALSDSYQRSLLAENKAP